jgi:hypothetical protein
MSPKSISSHQTNKRSQNESEKKKEKIIETDSTFGSRSSRQLSFGKPRFHPKRHGISKKLVNFDLKVFIFIERVLFADFWLSQKLEILQTNLGAFLYGFQCFFAQGQTQS